MKAITTESGTSWIMRFRMPAPATGSLWMEQVTTVIRSFRSPSASANASVLSLSEPRHRMMRCRGSRKWPVVSATCLYFAATVSSAPPSR